MVRNSNNIIEILFEHFATLATAPDGIARLRELILQLAVQGKLGTNNPTELPLKIDESKKRIRKTKSQKGNSNKIQIIDIFPLDSIPKNWKKTILDSVGVWSTGGTPSRREVTYFDGDVPWIKSGDLNDSIVTKTDETISQSGLDNSNAKLLPKGTISIALYGATIGKLGILGIEAATNQACANCVINEKIIISRYLFYFLRSQRNYLIQVGQGGAQPNITNWIIWEWPIVIPPLAEQHRIVTKVDRMMALSDEIEARLQQERAGCLKLGTASLAGLQNAENPEEFGRQWAQVCDAFEMILDCPENVAVLRQTILQLAVQGRLVPQEPGDQPAGKLVERIRKEKERLVKEGKATRDKRLEPITREDIKQNIPPNWALTRLGEIAEYNAERKISSNEISEDSWVFDLEDIEKDTSRILQKVRYKDRQSLSTKSKFKKGDILYGKLRPYLNKVVVADDDGYCTTEIVPIRPYLDIDPKYLMYALKTPDFLAYVNSKTYGIKMPRLGTVDAINTIIPLPPLAEQHRIVAKVDALMALCDALEARLKERSTVQGRLAGAVVKQVAG